MSLPLSLMILLKSLFPRDSTEGSPGQELIQKKTSFSGHHLAVLRSDQFNEDFLVFFFL